MPSLDRTKRTVLIVDDHPLVREWLANLINQQADLAVSAEADNRREALEAVRASKPDAAVVDISLGDSSGLELIKDLKQAHPEIRILAFTMHDESHYASRALRAGAGGYLVKREATGKVIDAIRAILAGKLVLSDSLAEAQAAPGAPGRCGTEPSPLELLSDRELEVFELLGRGLGTPQIAETLHLSIKTVQTHCAAVKEKLHLESGRELIREAVRWHENRQPQ